MKRSLLAIFALITALMVQVGPAWADDRICRGTIGSVHIDGNVIVPSGASCTLLGTRIDDNVEVERRGTLVARGVGIGGNLQTQDHRSVLVTPRRSDGRIARSRIGGDIQLESGGRGIVRRAVIGGNLQTKQNEGRQAAVRNRIDADLQAFSNEGGVRIVGNVIDGNLQCKSNSPPPTGGNNRVQGDKEDQCSDL
ncbi:MAG TPA: hypothetical protein VFI59_06030 [Actinomycetota bacterium]|nr:hypothetical protein [Actinomycetota bacterium]